MPKTTILNAEEIEALDDEGLEKYTKGIKRDKAVAEAQALSVAETEAAKKVEHKEEDSEDDSRPKDIVEETLKILEAEEAAKKAAK